MDIKIIQSYDIGTMPDYSVEKNLRESKNPSEDKIEGKDLTSSGNLVNIQA